MRTRIRPEESSRETPPRLLYDEDFALWVHEQVAALRTGDVAALDLQNLTLELEGLNKRDQRALGLQLKEVMADMLQQRYQPQRAIRSWQDSIRDGRERIEGIVDQSPSLRRLLPDLMTRNYPRAVAKAASETGQSEDAFPERPPFNLAEVLGEAPSSRP